MGRKTKQLLKLAEQLDKELDKSMDLFFAQRPFLDDPGRVDEGILPLGDQLEERVRNEYAIEGLVRKIENL